MFDKRKTPVFILLAILATGIYLRSYHINEPPIGYHSMKEVHYLSVAKGYLDHGDFIHRRVLYSGMSEGPGYLETLPQFPLLSFMFFLLWKIFGVKIWMARLVVILFSSGSVYCTYLVGRKLGGDEEVSLLAAFFMAILPLSVYFGRNIQPDAAALFSLLLFTYFFLRWLDVFQARYLLLFALFVFLTAIVKGTFLFMLVPLLFLFQFAALRDAGTRKIIIKQSMWIVLCAVLVAVWLIFFKATLTRPGDLFPRGRLLLSESFTYWYWKAWLPVVWNYVRDNVSFIYFCFFAVGLLWSALNFRSRISRYIIGSLVSAILYFLLISDFAVRHSYYHMPFLPMFSLGIAVPLSEGISMIEFKRIKYLKYAALALVLLFSVPFVKYNIDKQFDIQILGSDIAGRYIKEHGEPTDRIFISYGSPSDRKLDAWRTLYYGTLWEAGKRGNLLPADLGRIEFGEKERNMRWLLLYKTKWLDKDKAILDHIYDNYSIRQVGYKDGEVLYYLLRIGGTFDPTEFEARKSKLARKYEFSHGDVDVFVKEI